MDYIPTSIPEVFTITPNRHRDERGHFAETFRAEWFPEHIFVQDNHSHSVRARTLRGLHFQTPPYQQTKVIRVARGRVRDIAVDLRAGSPTFLGHVVVELSADNGVQVLVPGDFAHGFITLEPDTVVLYKVTNYHSATHERGIPWNDPGIAADWGIDGEPILSDRDQRHPRFDPATTPFTYGDS